MEPLNYCRQIVKLQMELLDVVGLEDRYRQDAASLIRLCRSAQKFLLPDGGQFLDDPQLKALDDDMPLHLPFPVTALEYRDFDRYKPRPAYSPGMVASTKRVLIATELHDAIVLTPVFWYDDLKQWIARSDIQLPKTRYIERLPNKGMRVNYYKPDHTVADTDYGDELSVFLAFISALRCSNVRADALPGSKRTKKIKSALPFDEYHVLTIDSHSSIKEPSTSSCSHRSPREHVRRGHVRRYENGSRVWVNATVVNAGRGYGKVTKDYEVPFTGSTKDLP